MAYLLWTLPIPPTTLTDGFQQELSHQASIKLAIAICKLHKLLKFQVSESELRCRSYGR